MRRGLGSHESKPPKVSYGFRGSISGILPLTLINTNRSRDHPGSTWSDSKKE